MFLYKRGLLPRLGLDCKLAPVHYGKRKVVNCLGTSSVCYVAEMLRGRPQANASSAEGRSHERQR